MAAAALLRTSDCRFGVGAILRNLKYPPWEEVSRVPASQHPDVFLCPLPQGGSCTRPPPGARSQDPETVVLTEKGAIASLTLSTMETMNGTDSD